MNNGIDERCLWAWVGDAPPCAAHRWRWLWTTDAGRSARSV